MRRILPLSGFFVLSAVFLLAPAAEPPKQPAGIHGPLTPQQAQKEFRLAPGLRIELVAAEPVIESPVAMAFDADGRLWIVEMRDYPNGPPKGQPPQGCIKVLEDRDGDGTYEHSTVFADKLLFAQGLLPWRDGVIVTAAPYIIHLRDTDGDGKADKREVLYEGFAAENPQLRVSHPILGIDNWLYVANGLRGGQVKRSGKPKPLTPDPSPQRGEGGIVNVSGMDFRFDPLDPDHYEAISGMGQFGNTFDDWGNRFVCDNRHHLRHIVLPNRYIQRNPYLAVPEVVEDVSELEASVPGAGSRIYPLSQNWTTSNLHAGRFTAACGVFVYRGDLLPKEFYGSAFTCDPTGDLIHQEVLRPNGASFRSKPPREGIEFLASPDDWCRPVSMAHGPDGALYVVDMYRAVIEHPEYMPTELKNRPDLTLGKDKGRIWRIVPEKFSRSPKESAFKPLSKATTPELVALLEHPNAWQRITAQRLLLERHDRSALPLLHKMIAESHNPLARLHAIGLLDPWMHEGFNTLHAELIHKLLNDAHPRIRAHAVLLSERWLAKSEAVQTRVEELAMDADPQVRFQVALTLGEWDDDRILPALAKIALAGADDRWTRYAVASSVPKRAGKLMGILLSSGSMKPLSPSRLVLLQELAALVGARQDPGEVADVLDVLQVLSGKDGLPLQMAGLNGLADGMGRRGTQLGEFLKKLPVERKQTAEHTAALLAQAAKVASEPKRELPDRLAAVRLLAHAPWTTAEPALTQLMAQDGFQEIRLAAVRALAAQPRPEVPGLLMKAWPGSTPAVRREVTEAMLRQPDRIRFLLKEVEEKRIKPGDLDTLRTRQLVNHSQPDIRDHARKLLQENLPAERKQVLERYQPALKLKADPKRGQAIFQKNCATCHRIAGVGVDVAPDISDTRTKTLEQLLLDILNPNAAIDSNYINYQVTTKNGKALTGIIAAETASSLTLRRAENQTDVVLRQDIEEIQSTGVSLMPEGLEKTISIEEMADLLGFLKNWRYLDGAVPVKGN